MDNNTFTKAVSRLQEVLAYNRRQTSPRPPFGSKDEVLGRYQPIFAREHLPDLTVSEFSSFLVHKNNKHWRGLHRQSRRITSDMETLRNSLDFLLYGEGDIAPRFTRSVRSVKGMGHGIASALLLVRYPDRYGVWNGTSEKGMKTLKVWPAFRRGSSEGEKYVAIINKVLLSLADEAGMDLWTLDALWWDLK
jgi:hypothetical protein